MSEDEKMEGAPERGINSLNYNTLPAGAYETLQNSVRIILSQFTLINSFE